MKTRWRAPSTTMPQDEPTVTADAELAVTTTVSAAELKTTASAVAMEMLRVPTVLCTPTRKPGQGPSDVESAAQRPDTPGRATASGARLLQGSVWHACDRRERGFRRGRYFPGP
ncbi:hypothetical protein GCM10010345_93770 [Streptomyces canarius]|uniref:Uncharacterized protein n=1 Tax=Streptomyces canarius TaxID=285453 RepID=A0ABQ3DCR6_9ACTN|nr:hypothetical protein GCM10010345_93770 [Streptomyces canarius]